ncbi:MAG TPA: TetR/AcrR family transcriptional regulator [Polyangiales bacterium]|nr:TetR/AcrR family transcriptional regulator [Polyangiales bacterium]
MKKPSTSLARKKAPRVRLEPARRLSPEARRNQIIAVAEQLFSSRSYAELGVPEVAAEIGITPGLVYHYFPSKEALLVAAVEQRAEELLAFCLPDSSLPFLVQVERGLKGYFDYVEAHSRAYRNLMRGPTVSEPVVMSICERTRMRIVEHYLRALGVDPTRMPATQLSIRAFFGYAEHAILNWLDNPTVKRPALERMCLGMMIAAFRVGLSSDPKSPFSAKQLAALEQAYLRHFDLQYGSKGTK